MLSWNLGVREVSGLGVRREPRSGATELLAVGDGSARLVTVRTDGSGRLPPDGAGRRAARHHRVDGLPDGLAGAGDGPDSQWEGVAGDSVGRVVVLRERGSELLVLSPELRFERRIALCHDWQDDGRAGLEGLLLLRGGHVLAAKQRAPLALLEFGPAGDAPIGVTPTTVLPSGEAVSLPPTRELRCLASWELADGTPGSPDDLRSANDLAVHGGFLLAVSSASRGIARLRLPLDGTRPVPVDGWWPLPDAVTRGRDAKAEGLAVDDRFGVLVGVDSHEDRDNLHRIGDSWPEDHDG